MNLKKIVKVKPGRLIVLGFFCVILIGALLLKLPVSAADGQDISFIDSLFTSTSAVCVTGLIAVDPGSTFSGFGQAVLGLLIQIGGLGITTIGVLTILVAKGNVSMGERKLMKEALNLSSGKGVPGVIRSVLYVTLIFEAAGAVLTFPVFLKDYEPLRAAGISLFHSVAAFNNAGFDIFGGFRSLTDYHGHVFLNLVTCVLIIFGGLGFFVITEIWTLHSWRRLSLHSKIVVSSTIFLLLMGTVLLKLTENTDWLGAFFQSTSARTAGFATEDIGGYSNGGILSLIVLMFIGASPGSTGGGIKTTTFFVLIKKLGSIAQNWHCDAFHRRIPEHVITKAFSVVTMALLVVLTGTFLLCMIEPDTALDKLLFEAVSAFSTTGLTAGITPGLAPGSKLVLVLIMFIGRLGPLTMVTIWLSRHAPSVSYLEEEVTIG